jgi:uncharacterized protein (DUF488 family)
MSSQAPTPLFTIGYEQTGVRGLIETLLEAGVTVLVDVRELPNSRRAGFSKRMLAASLAEAGIEYVHFRALGTPKEGRIANRAKRWEQFWSIVDTALATPAAAAAFEQVALVAREKRACLLCLEADHSTCHRLRVAETLAERYRFTVEHLKVELPSMV